MHNPTFLFATVAIACLAVAGCRETTSSQNIKTRGIVALIEVTATGEQSSEVVVTLKVGGPASNTYVDLEGGDLLFASADGEEKEMVAEDAGKYQADFDTGAEDTEFAVRLERDWDASADDNSGRLPAPFDITTDFGSTPLSRENDELVVEWDPSDSGDDMRLELEDGSCIFDDDFDIGGDSGQYTVPAGEISSTDSKDPGQCDVTLKLIRRRNGQADAHFDPDSRFRLAQVRETGFVSAP